MMYLDLIQMGAIEPMMNPLAAAGANPPLAEAAVGLLAAAVLSRPLI